MYYSLGIWLLKIRRSPLGTFICLVIYFETLTFNDMYFLVLLLGLVSVVGHRMAKMLSTAEEHPPPPHPKKKE